MRWNLLKTKEPVKYWLDSIENNFERFFDGFPLWKNDLFREKSFSPSVDISEDDEAYHVKAELPGIDEKNLNVEYEGGVLSITGEKHKDEIKKEGESTIQERSYGSFTRRFRLHAGADSDKITAEYKNGVLTIEVPKKESAKPKKIEIN